MNTLDQTSPGSTDQSARPGSPSFSSLDEIVALLRPLALRLLAHQEPPPELLRALNRSLVGPFRWAVLEIKRERLGRLREWFECEFCGQFLEWFQNAKAREIAEGGMPNAACWTD